MTDLPSNVEELPYRRPSETCNAQLHRGDGYCSNAAGEGTEHPGKGRCRLHMGDVGDMEELKEVTDLFRRLGFDLLIDAAEAMRHSDQEYLIEVGNNALVLQRTDLLRRMSDPTLTPAEMNHLTGSLARVDTLLIKHKTSVQQAKTEQKFLNEDDEELARVMQLARGGGLVGCPPLRRI